MKGLLLLLILNDQTFGANSNLQDIFALPPPSHYAEKQPRQRKDAIKLDDIFSELLEFPPTENDLPLTAFVGLYIDSIGKLDINHNKFHASVTVNVNWFDRRLKGALDEPMRSLSHNTGMNSQMWTPDIYVVNEADARRSLVRFFRYFLRVQDSPLATCRVYDDGVVEMFSSHHLELTCDPINLRWYPFVHPKCSIQIQSLNTEVSRLFLQWSPNEAVRTSDHFSQTKSGINTYRPVKCRGRSVQFMRGYRERKYESGCLSLDVYFDSSVSYELAHTFLPSALCVVVSWAGFIIDHRVVAARVGIAVTTMLVSVEQGNALRLAMPDVTYPIAIGLWHDVSLLFVFLALVEYCVVHFIQTRYVADDAADPSAQQKRRSGAGASANPKANLITTHEPLKWHTESASDLRLRASASQQLHTLGAKSPIRNTDTGGGRCWSTTESPPPTPIGLLSSATQVLDSASKGGDSQHQLNHHHLRNDDNGLGSHGVGLGSHSGVGLASSSDPTKRAAGDLILSQHLDNPRRPSTAAERRNRGLVRRLFSRATTTGTSDEDQTPTMPDRSLSMLKLAACGARPADLDRICLVIFPLVFALFNVLFFTMCTLQMSL